MTAEKKENYLEILRGMASQEGLSVELMDGITVLMDGISQEDDDSKLEEELESVKSSLRDEIAEKDNILAAYRRRWDESMVGTRVNGEYVDKTVTEVSDYTYEKLMGIE